MLTEKCLKIHCTFVLRTYPANHNRNNINDIVQITVVAWLHCGLKSCDKMPVEMPTFSKIPMFISNNCNRDSTKYSFDQVNYPMEKSFILNFPDYPLIRWVYALHCIPECHLHKDIFRMNSSQSDCTLLNCYQRNWPNK